MPRFLWAINNAVEGDSGPYGDELKPTVRPIRYTLTHVIIVHSCRWCMYTPANRLVRTRRVNAATDH